MATSKKSPTAEETKASALTPEQQRELVDDAIARAEKQAESQIDMARLFMTHGKQEIARRRLTEVIELYAKSEAAKEARRMLKQL